jgi:hypothetical protein
MPDAQQAASIDAFQLDPPVGVPAPAPLDMPRRTIHRLPFDVTRLVPRFLVLDRRAQDTQAG